MNAQVSPGQRVEFSVVEDCLLYKNLDEGMLNAIQNAIPDSLIHPSLSNAIFVPWTYENSAWLTTVKMPSVSPMLRDYEFPCPNDWTVMEHQMRIGEFVSRQLNAYVLAGMGSGKTASVLWAIDYLMRLGQIKKVLVVCPVAVVYDAWLPSIPMLFLDRYQVENLHKKKDNYMSNASIHVINIDKIELMTDKLLKAGYDCVVMDESTKIKNAQAKRTKGMKKLFAQAKYAWQLTGKPCPQGPMDAHGQITSFGIYNFTKTWWESSTMVDLGNYRKLPREGWQDIVHKYMQPAIRVETRDCVDLPPVTYSRFHIPLTAVQEEAIKALKRDKAIMLAGQDISTAGVGVLLQKISQIAAGAVYGDDKTIIEVKATKRLEASEELVEQSEGKAIIFVPFRHVATLVAEYFKKKGHKVGVITSDVKHRQPIFDKFQGRDPHESIDLLVAVPDAMAHGVTLTEASTIIWYGPPRSNEIYQQANARADRKGQKRHVFVAELWSHERERDMFDLARMREEDQAKFMEKYRRVKSDIQREFS